jgi:hypothetical protein
MYHPNTQYQSSIACYDYCSYPSGSVLIEYQWRAIFIERADAAIVDLGLEGHAKFKKLTGSN